MTTLPQPGVLLPDLTLTDQDGLPVRLRDLTGQTLVLYFYPKDDTPGCTIQACDLRDNWARFKARPDITLFGVSPDDAASHTAFRERYSLPFPLLVDVDHRLTDALGLWVEKESAEGKTMGVLRSTVIVGPDGLIQAIHRNVAPQEHVALLGTELGV